MALAEHLGLGLRVFGYLSLTSGLVGAVIFAKDFRRGRDTTNISGSA